MGNPDQQLKALAEAFRKLGFSDDQSRSSAEYQISSGAPELARVSFLKAAWIGVVSEENDSWIDRCLADYTRDPEGVGSGAGRALQRLLALGASRMDLTDLVRSMQFETLFEVCSVVDNCGDVYNDPLSPKAHWHLRLGEECPPKHEDVGGLHESVLETDPTGREMKPRPE